MNVERIGFILYVKAYKACIAFYANVLNLPVLFKNDDLTCFDFYGAYIMVEREDRLEYVTDSSEKKNDTCLRIHVKDVRSISERLEKQNISVDYQEHSWGKVAKFKDPEGNLIALRDEPSFAIQIKEFKNNQ